MSQIKRNPITLWGTPKMNKRKQIVQNFDLYLFLLPALIFIIVFMYVPMYGLLIAFKKYNLALGVMKSPWVGFENFKIFFNGYNFWDLIKNTLTLSVYNLLATLPLPILLAVVFNNVKTSYFKKAVQMFSYAPYFISVVVLVGMMKIMFAPDSGILNIVLKKFFHTDGMLDLFGQANYFRHLYVWSGVWQSLGWNSVIYVAALSGISSDLYEAAIIDGASRFKRIIYIELPSILPTAVIILILNTGSIINLGFEKVYLMQTPLNYSVSEIISTYVYKLGIINNNYSLSTAVGLFNSLVSGILLVLVNFIARKYGDVSLY